MDENKREKSSMYPSVPWNEAYDLVERISKMGKQASYATIANDYGLSSTTTKSFSSKISTARQFGLISVDSQVATLTDEGKRLIFPTDAEETSRIRIKCFSSPPLYRKLIERFTSKAIPSKVVLGNLLLHEYGISKAAKEAAASAFLSSIEQLGLSQSGVLILEESQTDRSSAPPDNDNQQPIAKYNSDLLQSQDITDTSQYHRFEVPTLRPGITATVLIPANLSELDMDFVLQSFNFMFPKFIENLKQQKESSSL